MVIRRNRPKYEYGSGSKRYNKWLDKHFDKLDKLEEEMYDLQCRIAMEEDEELPTVEEFYEWLDSTSEFVEEEKKQSWIERIWNKIFRLN